MLSSKNELYHLGNGWGWFVSIDHIDPHQSIKNIQTISKSSKTPKLEIIKSIRSMKSVSNLSNLHNDYEYDTKIDNDENYYMWGVNAVCILSIIAFGFIAI